MGLILGQCEACFRNMSFKVASHCPEIDPRWTRKYVPLSAPSGIFSHANDVVNTPKVDANTGETQQGLIWWLMMPTQMAQRFYYVCRMFLRSLPNFGTVWGLDYDAHTNISKSLRSPPIWQMSLFVCPFRANFGTVWGLQNESPFCQISESETHGFEPLSSQTKDLTIYTCHFLTRHLALLG